MKKVVKQTILILTLLILNTLLCKASNTKIPMDIISKDEAIKTIEQIFECRNRALLSKDLEMIKSFYDLNTKYGTWAFEYEQRKLKYLHNWAEKQGIEFTDVNQDVVIRSIKTNGSRYSANILCSTEYKYVYEDRPEIVNSFRIGTYHNLSLSDKDGELIITKEWYTDPFADSLNLENIKADDIKKYILSKESRSTDNLSERRINAADYAKKYCGAASEKQYGYMYNKKYRNYNPQGGDCANFASQILFEGGKFRKNGAWNYDKGGATRAWVNADGFKSYMLNSGRASVIAYGNYDKVYKASYKLLPGDFVAYEKKGDITHISVVTGADSRGYSLVTCHNTDRNDVPWDLGWSTKKIKFWLIRVHY